MPPVPAKGPGRDAATPKDTIRNLFKQMAKPTEPAWRGPEKDGVTQGMLSRFLQCRERFRVHYVEGLQPPPAFHHRVDYGNLWHAAEEGWAATHSTEGWETKLKETATALCRRFRDDQKEIARWYEICRLHFPIYLDYWSRHGDTNTRTPIYQEKVFEVNYPLPNGRTVKLRGKWDSVDLVGKARGRGVYLYEHKTKGQVMEAQLKRQLTFDLQTMLYLTALHDYNKSGQLFDPDGKVLKFTQLPILGVIYNVVRRPLSGGEGSIRQLKPSKKNPAGESDQQFFERLRGILAGCPQDYFYRWKVEVNPTDIERYKQRFLTPILLQLVEWYDFILSCPDRDPWYAFSHLNRPCVDCGYMETSIHWQHPFGIRNILDDGGSTDLDEYLWSGSEVGLVRVDNIFPELA